MTYKYTQGQLLH